MVNAIVYYTGYVIEFSVLLVSQCLFQLIFSKLYPKTLPKIIQIIFTIQQGLSKRQLYTECVTREVKNMPKVDLRRNIAFALTPCYCIRVIALNLNMEDGHVILVSIEIICHNMDV